MKDRDIKHDRVHIGLSKMVTDSAKNLIGEMMQVWQRDHFITDWQSAPYSQNQNMVESKIKSLFGKGIANLNTSGFPFFMAQHMIQMACNAMNNIWVKAINTSPMFARFGIKGNAKHFFPPGSRMHCYKSEELRAKGETHIDVLYYCGRPQNGGGVIGFCPKRVTVYVRRHVNIDKRFFYGDCVGSRLEEKLAMHKQAREWSEADTKAYLDDRYRGQVLEEIMRAGLANQSKEEENPKLQKDKRSNRLADTEGTT